MNKSQQQGFQDVISSLTGTEKINLRVFLEFARDYDKAEEERYKRYEDMIKDLTDRITRLETMFIGSAIALIGLMAWLISTFAGMAGVIK
jgi:hypothetical protein